MKWSERFVDMALQTKLLLAFITTTFILFLVNLFMYVNVNNMVTRLDEVYRGNISLNELADTIKNVQESMEDYLNTRTGDAVEDYYRYVQDYEALMEGLNAEIINNDLKLMERNIRRMSETYLDLSNQAIDAKRGRNVEKYRVRYEKATEVYGYIRTYIYSLNNEQFRANSNSYQVLSLSLHYLEGVNIITLILVGISNIILIILVTRTITNPLQILAKTAEQVAGGNLDVPLLEDFGNDEVGVVSKAFNKMIVNIREYIEKIKASMEKERIMQEKELKMESHLKDAQIKYLQAQINPHFLFNTLNAGAQLAMMEGADKTYRYVQNVADFFRYNVKKGRESVSLREEIELVDTYIYILNVRFSGDIHFQKEIDEGLLGIQVPSMILQPIVENCINYGIRGIDWEGRIDLKVCRMGEMACISVKDNGIGMEQEKIDSILSGSLKAADLSGDSNGIGLDNVIGRLRLFLDEKDVIDIISEGENKGTEVVLYIPLKDEEAEDV